ncbi:MAG: hypothetical protein HQK77_03420 [Desulfobacterales bacterium]|nr:hypothetical protein [Desulfobacterales bacterium]
MKIIKRSQRILYFLFFLRWILFPSQILSATDTDDSYFLSFKQKGQLIWYGEIVDNDLCYDIWICPGYVPPTHIAKRGWSKALNHMAEYVHIDKYHQAKQNVKDVFEWTFKECLKEFTIEGTPKAWKKYFAKANDRSTKRVFGWWFAHPWAFFQSLIDTTFRVPAGVLGTALGSVIGSVGVPVYHTLDSVTFASLNIIFEGTLLPVSGYTWNTIISPPLAVVGQRPDESRVDGFWVRITTLSERETKNISDQPFSDDELQAIVLWSKVLLINIQPIKDESDRVIKDRDVSIKQLHDHANQELKRLKQQETNAYQQILTRTETQPIIQNLTGRFSQVRINRTGSQLDTYLHQQGFTDMECMVIKQLLKVYPPTPPNLRPAREKTDPVKETMNVIKKIE